MKKCKQVNFVENFSKETQLGIDLEFFDEPRVRVNFSDEKEKNSFTNSFNSACLRFATGYYASFTQQYNSLKFDGFFIEFTR
jgi:hypothetical protein